jgi:peptide/nickel transport system substrate-binding protein
MSSSCKKLRWKRRTITAVLALVLSSGAALAQKPGGILKIPHGDSPASMSIHEESTIVSEGPMMAVFNNLVMFDQHIAQNRLDTIVPDLASEWSWNEDGTVLTFKLRQGVKWHDGKPFTAKDVKCTWDLLQGKGAEKLRINPRKSWWQNLEEVKATSDYEVSFQLKRPQPAFLGLLASGWSPVYPCHVNPRDMRQHPIGTGPFKFVEFKPNESIKLTKNPDYWKPGRPYLDGIEYTIIRNSSTWILALGLKQFDRTGPGFLSVALSKEVKKQAPDVDCEINSWNTSRTAIVNRAVPPFDNPDLRRAIMLSLDRKSFIDIIGEGQGEIGAAMQPPPNGVWGMPAEMQLARLRSRCRKEPGAGAGPDEKARLWAREAPAGHRDDAQCRRVPRSRGHSDRSAERDLYRRYAERDRYDAMVSDRHAQGLCTRLHRHRNRTR